MSIKLISIFFHGLCIFFIFVDGAPIIDGFEQVPATDAGNSHWSIILSDHVSTDVQQKKTRFTWKKPSTENKKLKHPLVHSDVNSIGLASEFKKSTAIGQKIPEFNKNSDTDKWFFGKNKKKGKNSFFLFDNDIRNVI